MKYSNELISKLKILSDLITKGLKDRINQLNLIDTGRMFSITESDIEFSDDGLIINITTTDYYKYLDGRYNLTDYVMDDPSISNMMTDIYGDMVIEIMFDEL